MGIILVVKDASLGESANLLIDRSLYKFNLNDILVGCSALCDLKLDDLSLSSEHFTISLKGKDYILSPRKGIDTPVFINDKVILKPTVIKNRSTFFAGKNLFRFLIPIPRNTTKRKKSIFSLLSTFLVVFVLCFEVFFVTWLPNKIQKQKIWTKEIVQQKTIELGDSLRVEVRNIIAVEYKKVLCKRFLSSFLGDMLMYINKNQSNMSEVQWKQMYSDLLHFKKIINNVQDKNFFKQEPKLDVENLLKEYLDKKISP